MEEHTYAIRPKNLLILAAAGVIVALALLLPAPSGLSEEGKRMLGILVVAAILWFTEAIPLAITGLLIMALQPLMEVAEPAEVFAAFGNNAVFFLIGAFALAAAIEKHGLHQRAALRFLRLFERSPRFFSFGIMLNSALLSFIIPEHAVVALLLPIIMHILANMALIPKQSNFGKVTTMAIAFGASIGSLGTLIGGARNPLMIGFLQETLGIQVDFVGWMRVSMPIVFITLPIVWLLLVRTFPIEVKDLTEVKRTIEEDVRSLGKMEAGSKRTIIIYALTILAWIFFAHDIGLGVIAIAGGIALFIMNVLSWEDLEERMNWGIILMYGGAITMGVRLEKTGAAKWIADLMLKIGGGNPYVIILLLIVLSILITELMSNTGAVAMLLPIGIGIAQAVDRISVEVASFAIALSAGLAFMLVVSTPGNLIAYSSGYFSPRDLLRVGVWAVIVSIVVIFTVAISYWRLLGLW